MMSQTHGLRLSDVPHPCQWIESVSSLMIPTQQLNTVHWLLGRQRLLLGVHWYIA